MINLFRKRATPAPTPVPQPERPIKAGSYVTLSEAHYVVAVNGDEATVSVRDPATGEQRHVVYPINRLRQVFELKSSGDARRVRLAPTQPAKRPADGDA